MLLKYWIRAETLDVSVRKSIMTSVVMCNPTHHRRDDCNQHHYRQGRMYVEERMYSYLRQDNSCDGDAYPSPTCRAGRA
jgi:hypothetical protein